MTGHFAGAYLTANSIWKWYMKSMPLTFKDCKWLYHTRNVVLTVLAIIGIWGSWLAYVHPYSFWGVDPSVEKYAMCFWDEGDEFVLPWNGCISILSNFDGKVLHSNKQVPISWHNLNYGKVLLSLVDQDCKRTKPMLVDLKDEMALLDIGNIPKGSSVRVRLQILDQTTLKPYRFILSNKSVILE